MQVTGLGALVVTPIVGNLSDRYGRKALMTLPVTMAIAPLCKWTLHHDQFSDENHAASAQIWRIFTIVLAVILACNRSEVYFYVYYVAKIIAGVFCEGTMHCLCLAYVVKSTDCNNRGHV